MDEVGQKPAIWKHIGLYGHAVGTFTGKRRNNNINERVPPLPESCLVIVAFFFCQFIFFCTHDMCYYLFVIGQHTHNHHSFPHRPYK